MRGFFSTRSCRGLCSSAEAVGGARFLGDGARSWRGDSPTSAEVVGGTLFLGRLEMPSIDGAGNGAAVAQAAGARAGATNTCGPRAGLKTSRLGSGAAVAASAAAASVQAGGTSSEEESPATIGAPASKRRRRRWAFVSGRLRVAYCPQCFLRSCNSVTKGVREDQALSQQIEHRTPSVADTTNCRMSAPEVEVKQFGMPSVQIASSIRACRSDAGVMRSHKLAEAVLDARPGQGQCDFVRRLLAERVGEEALLHEHNVALAGRWRARGPCAVARQTDLCRLLPLSLRWTARPLRGYDLAVDGAPCARRLVDVGRPCSAGLQLCDIVLLLVLRAPAGTFLRHKFSQLRRRQWRTGH